MSRTRPLSTNGYRDAEVDVLVGDDRQIDVDEDDVRRNEAIGPEEIDDFVAVLAPEAGEVVDDVAAEVDVPISLVEEDGDSLSGK